MTCVEEVAGERVVAGKEVVHEFIKRWERVLPVLALKMKDKVGSLLSTIDNANNFAYGGQHRNLICNIFCHSFIMH